MSSATSIDPAVPRTEASTVKGAKGRTGARPPRAEETPVADQGLKPWQFFVLAGMLSATAVVIVATGQSPAAIVILSLTVLSASLVAIGVHRSLVPLARPEGASAPQLLGGRTRAALEREKTLVLRAIKDLEFDFAMKKISQADFDELAVRLRARAMGLMQQLDAGSGYRRTIEQELEQRLGHAPATAGAADVTAEASEPDTTACASCGQDNDADARFCKHCGTRLVT